MANVLGCLSPNAIAIAALYNAYVVHGTLTNTILGLDSALCERTRTIEEMIGLSTITHREPKWVTYDCSYPDHHTWDLPAHERHRASPGEPSPLLLALISSL